MKPDATRLYVGNLAPTVTEEVLLETFSAGGWRVRTVRLVGDAGSGRPRGFAFVEMESSNEALSALEELDGKPLEGRRMRVETAPTRPHRARYVGERWKSTP